MTTPNHDPAEADHDGLSGVRVQPPAELSDAGASLHGHGPARPDHQPDHTGQIQFGESDGPVEPDHDAFLTIAFHGEPPAIWTRVGTIDDIPRLGSRVVKTAGADIAVFRTADDRVFALLDRCPHKQGKLSQGIVHGTSVTCPLHNWVIGLDDGLAKDPDEGCLNTIPVRLEGRDILLALPA